MGTHAHLSRLRYARHLVKRFAGSLWPPGGPSRADEAWAAQWLGEGELALWRCMSGPDRRHAVGVARRTLAELPSAERAVVAAALLHDVGKVEAGLGPVGRVLATLAGPLLGRRGDGDEGESGGSGGRGGSGPGGGLARLARYRRHDAIGASLLAAAGADPVTVAWAREHHLPPERWTLPSPVARALKAADDD